MASPLAYALPQGFDLPTTVGQLGRVFQLKGYTVRSYPLGAGACLELSKHMGGLNTAIGRCEGIKVNFMPGVNLLNVSFSDEQWTDKIVGFVVGWFTCWIPWIFTAIGVYSQSQLPKLVDNELRRILGTSSMPGTAGQPSTTVQTTYQYYQTYQPPVYPSGTSSPSAPPSGSSPAPPPAAPSAPSQDSSVPPQASAPSAPPVVPNPFKEGNPFDNPFEQKPPATAPSVPSPSDGQTFCRACGKPIPKDSVYCNQCGARQ